MRIKRNYVVAMRFNDALDLRLAANNTEAMRAFVSCMVPAQPLRDWMQCMHVYHLFLRSRCLYSVEE